MSDNITSVAEIIELETITIKNIFLLLCQHKELTLTEFKKLARKIQDLSETKVPYSGCLNILAMALGYDKYPPIGMYLRANNTEIVPNLNYGKSSNDVFQENGTGEKGINFYKAMTSTDK